uniref:G4 protein n=9 Tax=Bovine leukemia virus TaxID=11901 RepID=A0A5A4RJD8_BLV|nr:G4 protein [Bovine leukemia virus]
MACTRICFLSYFLFLAARALSFGAPTSSSIWAAFSNSAHKVPSVSTTAASASSISTSAPTPPPSPSSSSGSIT